ncbi:hypothetical protein [Salinimicrobium sediminilitoris]|uniref:hypothetical protein n=1 Tax=Salinimicrobium sediminilitoris TaxID=2876715 RepID=UPI001E63716E|nr:hypothetical protein [Salinimicrobium sediminilitoris]MCC8358794.1 hypothetical protein [Salinimicrobium sediminilitoris]
MKNFKTSMAWLAMFAMIFTSCSKEEAGVISDDPETVQLTFGALLNSFNQQNKQAVYECDAEAVPAYVMLGWSTEEDAEMDDFDLIQVDLVNNNGSWETVYSEDLAAPAGTYYLQHFAVYDASDQVLWVAPREGGSFATEVDDALPLTIELVAGTKPYIDVDVLCYIAREETAYGYPFFDFDVVEVENSYCVFVNYCDDETGRDYPAYFNIDVYTDAAMTDEVGISNDTNVITMAGDWPSASVLCFALPDLGDETYYARVTVLNHDDLDYTANEGDYYDFEITQASIDALEVQIPAYHHIIFECGDTTECNPNDPDADCDNDNVPNSVDECPGTPPGVQVNELGCEDIQVPGRDIVVFNDINLFKNNFMTDPDNVRLVQNLVTYTTEGSRNDGDVVIMDFGRGAECATENGNGECVEGNWDTMRNTIQNEGFSITDIYSTSGSITSIPSDVKIIFLVMPTVDYTVEEINTLKAFAAQGGRIVFVGEWDGYYSYITVQNQFLLNMGAVLHNTGGAVDCGAVELPESSNRSHPIMEGVGSVLIGCASVIEPGPNDFALFYDSSNTQVLAGVAKIDVTPLGGMASPTGVSKKTLNNRTNDLNSKSSSGY